MKNNHHFWCSAAFSGSFLVNLRFSIYKSSLSGFQTGKYRGYRGHFRGVLVMSEAPLIKEQSRLSEQSLILSSGRGFKLRRPSFGTIQLGLNLIQFDKIKLSLARCPSPRFARLRAARRCAYLPRAYHSRHRLSWFSRLALRRLELKQSIGTLK